MLKNIIFDMDGVLVDSEPMYLFQMRRFTEQYGVRLTMEENLRMVGRDFREDMDLLSEKFDNRYSPEELEKRYKDFSKKIRSELPNYVDILMPYVKFVLPRFRDMGLKLGIASSSSKDKILRAVHECEIDSAFDLFVSGDEFTRSKPDPEIYLTTLKRMQASAEETIVIEDSTYGIEAAKRAGLLVIARKDDRFCFDQTEADYTVGSLYEAYFLVCELLKS
uniref:HAD family hydrolase n=1 Tax=Ndongobacter massiliensis TaxID=1871025 RepID=UPI0009F812AF|nr:HAD family phosphatase [Ndongobacter massiliensis]